MSIPCFLVHLYIRQTCSTEILNQYLKQYFCKLGNILAELVNLSVCLSSLKWGRELFRVHSPFS